LRGGHYSNQRTLEDDAFQDHEHIDEGHTHTDQGHSHHYGDYMTDWDNAHCTRTDTIWGPDSADKAKDRFDCNRDRTSSSSEAQLAMSVSGVGTVDKEKYSIDSETRPANMNVIWIMRVW